MSARSKARKQALDILFESDIRGSDPLLVWESRQQNLEAPLSESAYVSHLLTGVQTRRLPIDQLIATYAQGWDMDRMPAVDRNILRLAIFELFDPEEKVPAEVAIHEAVTMASELSTDESGRYINGILGRLLVLKPTIKI